MHENVAPPWFVAVTFPPDRSLPFHTTPTLTCTAARLKSCRMLSGSGERGEGDCGSWAAWLQALLTGLSNNLPGAGGAGSGGRLRRQRLQSCETSRDGETEDCCIAVEPHPLSWASSRTPSLSLRLPPSLFFFWFGKAWKMSISETKVVNDASESSDLSFCLSLHLSQSEITELPSHHRTHRCPLLSSHIIPWLRMCCVPQKKKFTSSYRQEMTNATFFMRRIKNSKDLFPSLHSETQGKKTSLNNGWEKGLLRKESRCGMIEQRGARRGGRRG